MKFSIVVPVYNAEKYLRKCLDSLKNQTMNEYEVIIIDDGSTDGSGAICDSYAKDDDRFSVIHKENGGLVSARRIAASVVKGEYVLSVDSDDWIEESYLQDVAEAIEAIRNISGSFPDMIAWNYTLVDEKDRIVRLETNPLSEGYYEGDNLAVEKRCFLYDKRRNGLNSGNLIYSIWTKAVKREIYVSCQSKVDERIQWGEDAYLVFLLMQEIRSLLVVGIDGYMFRSNPDSMTHKPDENELYRINLSVRKMSSYLDVKKLSINQIYAYAANVLYLLLYRYATTDWSSYAKMIIIARKLQICEYVSLSRIEKTRMSDKLKLFMLKHKLFITLGIMCRLHNLYLNISKSGLHV